MKSTGTMATKVGLALVFGVLCSWMALPGRMQAQGGGGSGNSTTPAFNPTTYLAAATAVGDSTVGTASLINLGSASLTIATITLAGPNAGDFALSGTCANGLVIPSNSNNFCTLQLAFSPTASGSRTAEIDATFANAPPLTLPLAGLGLVAAPRLSSTAPSQIDFGSAQVGVKPPSSTAFATIVISNGGGRPLTLNSFGFSGANAGDFVFGSANRGFSNCIQGEVVNPLSTCYIGINFAPTAVGPRSASFTLSSNDPVTSVLSIALSGIGLAAPPPPPPPPRRIERRPIPLNPPLVIRSTFDFTDLWGNTAEPGWTICIDHHRATTDTLVAYWLTYDVDGRSVWFKLTDGHWIDSMTYTGTLHRATGPSFNVPYNPNLLVDTVVGSATLSFVDVNTGSLSYNVGGTTGLKTISRLAF
jgi:hypothetical protein